MDPTDAYEFSATHDGHDIHGGDGFGSAGSGAESGGSEGEASPARPARRSSTDRSSFSRGPGSFRSQTSMPVIEDADEDTVHAAAANDFPSLESLSAADAAEAAAAQDDVSKFLDSDAASVRVTLLPPLHCPAELHRELSELHKVIDEKGDLTETDLLDVLYACGVANPQDRMHQLMTKIGTDGDKRITRFELELAMKLWGADPNAPLHEFKRTDSFNKGVSRRRTRNSRASGDLRMTRRSLRGNRQNRKGRRRSWILDQEADGHIDEARAIEELRQAEEAKEHPDTPAPWNASTSKTGAPHGRARRESSERFELIPPGAAYGSRASRNSGRTSVDLTTGNTLQRSASFKKKFDQDKIKKEMKAIFDEVDLDQDGAIGIDEFVKLIQNWNTASKLEEDYSVDFVKEIFQEIDLDGNGELDFDEFALAFETLVERSMHGDNSISLTAPTHLKGIEAAQFKAATARVSALEQDLVKQKLQHLAETRELKDLAESTTDQLDESLTEMADQEKHFHTQERKLEHSLQQSADQVEVLTQQLEAVTKKLSRSEADRTGGSKLHRLESLELEEQLVEVIQSRDELLEENSVFEAEVDRLHQIVNELQLENDEASAILQQVQDDRRNSPSASQLGDALAELEESREKLDELQAENDSLHHQLDAYELLALKSKTLDHSLQTSMDNLAAKRKESYPSRHPSLGGMLDDDDEEGDDDEPREANLGVAKDIPFGVIAIDEQKATQSAATAALTSAAALAALQAKVTVLDGEMTKIKARNTELETLNSESKAKLAQQKWQSASDTGKLAKALKSRAAAFAERDTALQQVASAKHGLAQLQEALDKANADCTAARDALSAAEAEAAQSAAAAARAVEQLAMQTKGMGAADAARATVAKVQAELEQAIADLQAAQQARSAAEEGRESAVALLKSERTDRQLADEATKAKVKDAEDGLAEAAALAASANGSHDTEAAWELEISKVRADLANALLKATQETAQCKAAEVNAAAAKKEAVAAGVETDKALSELAAALLAKTKAEMRADDEARKAQQQQQQQKTTPSRTLPSPPTGTSSWRRSVSTSSFQGDDAARAAELQRKLELKIAELNKVKAQLKAEKTQARRAAHDLAREHEQIEAVRLAAVAERAAEHLRHIQGSIQTSRRFTGLLSEATTILHPTGLTQAEVEARLRQTPDTAVRMLQDGNEYTVNTSDTSGIAPSSSTEGGGSSNYHRAITANNNTNNSAFKFNGAGDDGGSSSGTPRAVEANPHPWWLDAGPTTARTVRPRVAPPPLAGSATTSSSSIAAAAAAQTSPRTTRPPEHTGRRTWNENTQWFQDRNTPRSTPAVSSVGGDSVTSEPSVMSPSTQHETTNELSDYDFVDASLANNGGGGGDGNAVGAADGLRPAHVPVTRLGGGPAVLGRGQGQGQEQAAEQGGGEITPSRGEQDSKRSTRQLNTLGLRLDLQESIML